MDIKTKNYYETIAGLLEWQGHLVLYRSEWLIIAPSKIGIDMPAEAWNLNDNKTLTAPSLEEILATIDGNI